MVCFSFIRVCSVAVLVFAHLEQVCFSFQALGARNVAVAAGALAAF